MLLVRVILGRSYIHNGDETLTSLPCLKGNCMTPNCQEHQAYFDSAVDVLGKGHRMVKMFDTDSCIPEFRITYTRGNVINLESSSTSIV